MMHFTSGFALLPRRISTLMSDFLLKGLKNLLKNYIPDFQASNKTRLTIVLVLQILRERQTPKMSRDPTFAVTIDVWHSRFNV